MSLSLSFFSQDKFTMHKSSSKTSENLSCYVTMTESQAKRLLVAFNGAVKFVCLKYLTTSFYEKATARSNAVPLEIKVLTTPMSTHPCVNCYAALMNSEYQLLLNSLSKMIIIQWFNLFSFKGSQTIKLWLLLSRVCYIN